MDGFAGAIGVSDSDGKSSPVVHCYRPAPGIDPRFYAYILRDLARRGFISSLAKGIRERSTAFDAETFRSLQLPVPAPEEQRAIADYLDAETTRIDALITKKQQLVDLVMQRCRQSVLTAVFGGAGTELKAGLSSGSDMDDALPADWTVARLIDLVTVRNGPAFASETIGTDAALIPLIRIGGVTRGVADSTVEGPVAEMHMVDDGDLVLSLTGSFAVVHWTAGRAAINQRVCAFKLRPGAPALLGYLGLVLPPYLEALEALTYSTTLKNLSVPTLLSERVPIPPLGVQEAIVLEATTQQSKAAAMASNLTRQIALLAERRQALVTAAVTGEFRVPGVV